MFIESFAEDWWDEFSARICDRKEGHGIYLLIDGVFVPGLHRSLPAKSKILLFESLPGCTEAAKDVSPFLIRVDQVDIHLRTVVDQCNRWPMISMIETSESIQALAARLAVWCIVEVDEQRFNFRFPDTRRLPGIVDALTDQQRAQITGGATRWSYVARSGRWADLPVDGVWADVSDGPALDSHQFAALVNDSRADELLMLLRDRGHDCYAQPSKNHAMLLVAMRVASAEKLDDADLMDWCESVIQTDAEINEASAARLLHDWRALAAIERI